jgi:sporulation protein YlmC with PRC-barrel domain
MIGKLLATSALLLVLTGTASAQTADGAMLSAGYQMTATDALASKLIGSNVYSTVATNNNAPAATTTTPANGNNAAAMTPATPADNGTAGNANQAAANANAAAANANEAAANANNAAANANAANANKAAASNNAAATTAENGAPAANANGTPAQTAGDTNAQQIGTIRDHVLNSDGSVAAVVVGVGGFLGMGEKNVAVAYSDLHWTVAQDGSVRSTLDTTADALKNAPDFKYPADNANAAANTAAPANNANNNMAAAPANNAAAPANNNMAAAPANQAAATTANANASASAPDVDMSTLKPTNMTTIKADEIKGIDVLDPNGDKIASVNDVVLTKDGKVDAVVVDFGGFLGIGTKQIALAFEGLKFMDDANNKHYLVVNVTKEQLDAAKAYNKDDYAANRDAERLTVGQ